jgi:hypothetical protein
MKFPILFSSLFVFVVLLGSVRAEEKLIIQTRFDIKTGSELLTVEAPENEAALPLTSPTGVSAREPSAIVSGSEKQGELKPPYALVELRSDPAGEGGGQWSAANIDWDLRKLQLEPGRYSVRFELTLLEVENDGGTFLITFCDDAGELFTGHPIGSRIAFVISKGMIGLPVKTLPAALNTSYKVEMIVDTENRTSVVLLDGEPILEESEFPESITSLMQNGCRIAQFSYRSAPGLDYSNTGKTTIAIRNVEMARMP